jgi:hypothetical protein
MSQLELEDARASLAYWEGRARRLPRHALRKRREAREMAGRWRTRVADAERAVYGRGLLGALLLLAAERRLPEPARRAGRRAARAVLIVSAALVAFAIAGLVAAVELLAAILRALS